ncbi:MAG: BrnT family toxin [Gemmatimonadaceae bacterium]|nr:BrnT family toxin [Gemmatimonadaceae bacterium]
MIALGLADGIPLTVVFTDRIAADGSIVRRVISARVSSRKERQRYAKSLEAICPQDDADTGSR